MLLILLTVVGNVELQLLPSSIDESWGAVYRGMRSASDLDINLRSNCPWTYVKFNNQFYPVLFDVVKTNCIDLDRSTEDQLYLTMTGVCTPIRDNCPTSREIVGFTCMKLIETETVKRNEVFDPWNQPFEPPKYPPTTFQPAQPIVTTNMYADKDEDKKGDSIDDNDDFKKGTTTLHQNLVPPFSNPFNSPSFLMNGANQFQPAFLNSGMNVQADQPPPMMQFDVSEETRSSNVENESELHGTTEETVPTPVDELEGARTERAVEFIPDQPDQHSSHELDEAGTELTVNTHVETVGVKPDQPDEHSSHELNEAGTDHGDKTNVETIEVKLEEHSTQDLDETKTDRAGKISVETIEVNPDQPDNDFDPHLKKRNSEESSYSPFMRKLIKDRDKTTRR